MRLVVFRKPFLIWPSKKITQLFTQFLHVNSTFCQDVPKIDEIAMSGNNFLIPVIISFYKQLKSFGIFLVSVDVMFPHTPLRVLQFWLYFHFARIILNIFTIVWLYLFIFEYFSSEEAPKRSKPL